MQSQSGTGKTGTFLIGCLERIARLKGRQPGQTAVLVLSPTRELAEQTAVIASALAGRMDVHVRSLVGGTRVADDVAALGQGIDIVSGTPGRVNHMIERGLDLRSLELLVIDEVDELLNEGFAPQIRQVLGQLPPSTQIVLSSATMREDMLAIAAQFMRDPLKILVKTEEVSLVGLAQYYVDVGEDRFKVDCLADLYGELSVAQTVIFVNLRRTADWLAQEMQRNDFSVSVIHSDLPQVDRSQVLKQFKLGKQRVLIATDIVARGIDVQQVSLVVNYDLPRDPSQYIHRIGRCARFGRKGAAINLVTERDTSTLRGLERFYDTEILPLPRDLSLLLK